MSQFTAHSSPNLKQPARWQRLKLFKQLACCASLLALLPQANACGPEFPMQLLDGREQNLLQLPEPTFAEAIGIFQLPLKALPEQSQLFQSEYDWERQQQVSASMVAERQLLSAETHAQVQRMRAAPSFAEAFALGEGLDAELRWYTAGAVAFAQQDWVNATSAFQQVLALPQSAQTQRRSWALYSLARVLLAQNQPDAALVQFKQLYDEVAAGLADPLNLAVSALGEQARIALAKGDWQQAIALYGSQAKYDQSGQDSLRLVARQLLRLNDAELSQALQQQHVATLLTRFLLTQYQSLSYEEHSPLPRLTKLLIANATTQLENATELAAISYQQGEYDLAAQLLQLAKPSALGHWLTAKLALRQGNQAEAAAAYAQASQAFATPATAMPLSSSEQCRVQAEHGVLQLQRGEYLQALALLMASREYWLDAAYVAERVLTIEELQQYVEAKAPGFAVSLNGAAEISAQQQAENQLRAVLARRLMRSGKVQQALRYFNHEADYQAAVQYHTAMKAASSFWQDDISKAQALFKMAQLTREHGMALFGYELAPDYAVFDGYYELWNVGSTEVIPAQESQRVLRASDAKAKRFHYRYTASALADKAADLLPANSQAFAATLCYASQWLLARDAEAAAPYYRRYLNEGPYVSWGETFGQTCPEPDFVAANARLAQNQAQQWRQWRRKNRTLILALGCFALLAIAGFVWRRSRKTQVSN